MTRKNLLFFAVAILTIFLVACSSAAESSYDSVAMEAPASAPAFDGGDFDSFATTEEMSYAQDGGLGVTSNSAGEASSQVYQERLIIRTANLSLLVSDTDEAMATISKMAEDNGGWVVNSSVYQYNETAKTGNITIRVPSAGFNSALEALRGLAVEVRNESTSGQDVTEEFVDLSARLENLEATAERVRAFLEDADTVEEALAVNQELSRLESEIEAMKGRLQYLSESASFSTITVDLTPDVVAQPIDTSWRPAIVFRNAIDSLVEALQSVAEFAIWFVIYMVPLLIVVGVPLWLVGRFIWRRIRRRGSRRNVSEVETAVSNE